MHVPLEQPEEVLIKRYRQGDTTAFNDLLNLYRPYINFCSRMFFCKGLSPDDLFQEGSVGLYKALLRYDPNKGSTFKRYAETNIKGMIINAVRKGNRLKHSFLNQGISLHSAPSHVENNKTYIDFLPSSEPTPEEQMMWICDIFEKKNTVKSFMATLSDLEKGVLTWFVNDCSHKEIALQLGVHMKAVDNALTRIKRKIASIRQNEKTKTVDGC
ncbi:sigma-70 family RNA polymerase sigma factor [Paenibacillus taichungensis]